MTLTDLAVEARLRPRSFDTPGARLPIDTMAAWMAGEPVWPYDKIIETWGTSFMCWRRQWRKLAQERLFGGDAGEATKRRFEREIVLMELRFEWIGRYGFAVPCAELLDALASAAPIVEVGAGSGYMTRLMRHRGIDVIGSDIEAMNEDSGHGFIVGEHDPQQVGGVEAKTMVRRYPDRAVFCSWPTLHRTWFRQMLRAMRIGRRLIVIREEACAEHSAWAYINSCFEHVRDIELPCFPGLHDWAGVYIKRRQNAQTKS